MIAGIPEKKGNPYLIWGNKPGQPLGRPKAGWERLCRMARIKDCHLHDLRHTTATAGYSGGASLGDVGKMLGHRDPKSTMIYADLWDHSLHRAIESTGSTIDAMLKGRPKAEVVAIRKTKT